MTTSRSRKWVERTAGVIGAAVLGACGAGTPVSPAPLPEKIEVRVSAGAPVAGAVVTVYAISDVTGLPDSSAGAGGVLGSAGPTDSSGRATITLASRGFSGPVQLVASGPSMFYADPTAASAGGSSSVVQVPATFSFSSYVSRFSGSSPVVPVTLMTTLADRAALAWARGRHASQRTPTTLSAALAARDPLFVAHVTKDVAAWTPTAFRSTVPALLADAPHTLVDAAYAAFFDLALNQLARETATRANSSAITAVVLAQLLQDDLDADGRFDGRGVGGILLATPGDPPVALNEQLLRVPLARALDDWIRNSAVNRSGIGQADLVSARVYEALTTDASDLFGGPPAPGVFDPVDRTPPVLAFTPAAPQYTNQTTLTLTINATDATGVKGVFAQSGTRKFTANAGEGGTWILAVDLVPGHNPITIWGEDTAQAGNSGLGAVEPHQFVLDVLLDTSPPTAVYVPYAGSHNKIEFCDIYTRTRCMCHIKRYGASSVLSHLFSQGVVAAEAFLADSEFRGLVNAKLPKAFRLADPALPLDSKQFEVVFGITSKADETLQLPFFSRVTLRNAHRRLSAMGYRVSLVRIPVQT